MGAGLADGATGGWGPEAPGPYAESPRTLRRGGWAGPGLSGSASLGVGVVDLHPVCPPGDLGVGLEHHPHADGRGLGAVDLIAGDGAGGDVAELLEAGGLVGGFRCLHVHH